METRIKDDGTKFAIYPFEFDGHKFISRVLFNSEIHKKVTNVPEHYFALMNQQCLSELMGEGKSLDEIKARLYEINKGGSSALIELADEE
jgi:hypothetical protein